jgi:hypothetical protein
MGSTAAYAKKSSLKRRLFSPYQQYIGEGLEQTSNQIGQIFAFWAMFFFGQDMEVSMYVGTYDLGMFMHLYVNVGTYIPTYTFAIMYLEGRKSTF